MNHVVIPSENEPVCLKVFRSNPVHTYKDLEGECKREVVKQLSDLQNELCAYCERKFSRPELPIEPELAVIPHIEHYLPQAPSKFPQLQLNWDNFLAVCSGKFYKDLNDRKAGIKTDFCSHKRGDSTLSLDPRVREHVQTLFYDGNHRICSKNKEFDKELNTVFNLNFDAICRDRADRYMDFDSIFMDDGERMNLTREEIISKAIPTVKNECPGYKSFILYRYNEELKELKQKSGSM
ncbi:MAG: hypothetical protein IPP04_16950 [Saprospiraceae bacterium]|nr:hypothetical protein [Saprospiraceae bacterium]